MIIKYNPKLKELARELRRNATKSEVCLWQKLKLDQIHGYDFHRQKPIDEYIVEFFCNKLRLAIEVDGYSHQLEEIWEKDAVKTNRLNELGIHVLRFSDTQVLRDMDNVLRAIEEYIFMFEASENTPPSIPPS
ncbi:endonuclease domain-containing protein [Allomuricauda sp. F6463D]|uniref:endonuclease domain-containing protein n=1 Tax=Allomuricauda sp. F6463D TaxID=2926409 RepID=UPI001FF5640B|nr:endonuclease domain-containing protein [Muricauda sp. F6463D]MCK0162211.1 endonuclease domain-containing protein [Muricauda sp. F6463D]